MVDVDIGHAGFLDLTAPPHAIGTEGLRGCFGVLIATESAAIVAHVKPTAMNEVMKELRARYTENKVNHFQGRERVWVVSPTILGGQPGSSSLTLTDMQRAATNRKQEIIQELANLGLRPVEYASYTFHFYSDGTSPEFEDKGTIRIDARTGRTEAYVENRVLHYFSAQTSDWGQSSRQSTPQNTVQSSSHPAYPLPQQSQPGGIRYSQAGIVPQQAQRQGSGSDRSSLPTVRRALLEADSEEDFAAMAIRVRSSTPSASLTTVNNMIREVLQARQLRRG